MNQIQQGQQNDQGSGEPRYYKVSISNMKEPKSDMPSSHNSDMGIVADILRKNAAAVSTRQPKVSGVGSEIVYNEEHHDDEEKADKVGETPGYAEMLDMPTMSNIDSNINNGSVDQVVNASINATAGSRQQRAEMGISQFSDVNINLAFGESRSRNLNRVNMPSGGPTFNSNIQSIYTVNTVNTLNTLNTVNTMNTMNSGMNTKLDSLNSVKANHPSINIGNSNSNISNYNYVDYNRGTMSKIDETASEFDVENGNGYKYSNNSDGTKHHKESMV